MDKALSFHKHKEHPKFTEKSEIVEGENKTGEGKGFWGC